MVRLETLTHTLHLRLVMRETRHMLIIARLAGDAMLDYKGR